MILRLQFGEILRHAAMDKMGEPNRKLANGIKNTSMNGRVGEGLAKNPIDRIARVCQMDGVSASVIAEF
jgi:hypothetical protein